MEQQHIARATRRTVLAGIAATLAPGARAQQRDGMRRIGVLTGFFATAPGGQASASALVQGLAALGWHEGVNLLIDWRWAGDDFALFQRYAAELVALDPEVLLASGNVSVEALRRKTSTIPIIFMQLADPVGQGFVASLARPGGNITGFSNYDPPMAGKWLEMLTQIIPPVSRVAVLYNPTTAPYADLMLRAIEAAATSLKLAVHTAPVHDDAEIEATVTNLSREERGGLLVLPDPFTVEHRGAIVAAASHRHLPAVYTFRFFAASGGLMSYGIESVDTFRRAPAYVDRVLKGAKPADLPVQAPTKFELVINLKTAKAIGVAIAPSLLATADEVIE